MAVSLPPNWTTFDGGDDGTCDVSTPVIAGAIDLDCHGAASVTLTVSGGIAPYSWGTTLGVLSAATGTTTTLTPPVNPYAGAANTNAYQITTKFISTFCDCRTSIWDCYGGVKQTCLGSSGQPCWGTCDGGAGCSCSSCASAAGAVCDNTCTPSCSCGKPQCSGVCPEDNLHCFCINGTGSCQPCAISMNAGAVVTVTDSLGQTDFVTIYATPRTTV